MSSRFLVFPTLGRSLQSILDDFPKHVMSVRSVFQMACRLVGTGGSQAPIQGMLPRVLVYQSVCSLTHSARIALRWALGQAG